MEWLESQQYSTEKLNKYLKDHFPEGSLESLKTLNDIQSFIGNNSSFYDYKLVKYLIEVTRTDDTLVLKKLQEYEEAFHQYAARRVYECTKTFDAIQTKYDTVLHVKLDKTYDDCTLIQLEDLESNLFTLLRIPLYVVRLHRVERGCFRLTFLLPRTVPATVFPLPDVIEKVSALKQLGILQITCGKYQYPSDMVSLHLLWHFCFRINYTNTHKRPII